MKKLTLLSVIFLLALLAPTPTLSAEANNGDGATTESDKATLKTKLWVIGSTLFTGNMGLFLPSDPRATDLRIDKIIYRYMVVYKGYGAGVILAVGFVHLLPDAYQKLTSPLLDKDTWGQFPMLAFIVAMTAAVLTVTLESVANSYLGPRPNDSQRANVGDEEQSAKEPEALLTEPLLSHRVVSASSKVLKVSIWACTGVSSMIIGFSLGASESEALVGVLSCAVALHQTFKHTGLVTCLPRPKSLVAATTSPTIAVFYFCVTTPVGFAIGIGTSRMYKENSPSALILQGISNAATAGILIYHSLVHMMVADFLIPKVKRSVKLQVGAYAAFLIGCCLFTLQSKIYV